MMDVIHWIGIQVATVTLYSIAVGALIAGYTALRFLYEGWKQYEEN